MLRRTTVARRAPVLNFLKEPWERQTFAEASATQKAAGEDIASNLTSDFVQLQIALVPYRIKRAGTELNAAFAQPGLFFFTKYGLVSYAYCAVAYFIMKCIGRDSLSPLENP
jgi:hypothetical protein